MKKQINEIKKMQRIAGLITESEYQEEIIKDEEKVNEVYGLENDDLIYDNMVTMDIEQLVSDMLSTVEKEPSSTLKDYVLKYDSSEDDNDDYDTDYKEPNEPFDMAEAKGKTGDETWFSDVKYFKKEHEGYKLKPTDMVSIGDIPAMTYANAIKKFGLKEEFGGINEKTDPYDQFIKKTKTGKELQPFHPKMKHGFEGYKGKENIKAKDMSSQKLTGAGYYRMSDDEFKKYQDLGLDGGSARVPFKLEGLNEILEPHVYERMYNLSSIKAQQAMIRAAEIMMNELTNEGFEVEEIREFFHQLIANDI